MAHYLVACDHALRAANSDTIHGVARQAFGVPCDDRITLCTIPKKPASITRKLLNEIQTQLAVRHFRRTGNVISGFEKESGIKNVHWTSCQLCRIPILTEPKSKGIDDVCCVNCEQQLNTISKDDQEKMSISDLRQKLTINIHRSASLS